MDNIDFAEQRESLLQSIERDEQQGDIQLRAFEAAAQRRDWRGGGVRDKRQPVCGRARGSNHTAIYIRGGRC